MSGNRQCSTVSTSNADYVRIQEAKELARRHRVAQALSSTLANKPTAIPEPSATLFQQPIKIRKDLRVENILGDHNDAKQLFPNAVGIDSSAYPHTPLIDKKRPFPTKPKDRSRPKTPSSAKNHVPTSVGAIVHDSARPDKPLPDKYNGSAPRERSSSRDGQQTSRRYSAESLPNQSVSPIKPSHNTKPGANSYNDRSNHDRQNQKSQPTSASIPGISDESPVRKHPKPPSKPPPQQKGGNIVCDDKKPKVKAEDKTNQIVDNTFHMPPTISNNKRLPLKIKIEHQGLQEHHDVADMLQEMKCLDPPVTAILTPHKEEPKFPFPVQQIDNHAIQQFRKKAEKIIEPVTEKYLEKQKEKGPEKLPSDIAAKPADIKSLAPNKSANVQRHSAHNTSCDIDKLDPDVSEDSDSEKLPHGVSSAPSKPHPAPGPARGVGGKVPIKEPKPMSSSSDSSSSDGSDEESGSSGSDSPVSEGENEDEDENMERPKTPPIKTPPPPPEQKKTSWALEKFMPNTPSVPTLSTNSQAIDEKGSPCKEDPNNEVIDKIFRKFIKPNLEEDRGADDEGNDDDDDYNNDSDDSISKIVSSFKTESGSSSSVKNVHKSPGASSTGHGSKHASTSAKRSGRGRPPNDPTKKEKSKKKTVTPQTEHHRKNSKVHKSKAIIETDSEEESPVIHPAIKMVMAEDDESIEIDVLSVTPEKSGDAKFNVKDVSMVSAQLDFHQDKYNRHDSKTKDKKSSNSKSSKKESKPEIKASGENSNSSSSKTKPPKYSHSSSKEKSSKKSRTMKCNEERDTPVAVVAPMKPYEEMTTSNTSFDKDSMHDILDEFGRSEALLSPLPNVPEKPQMIPSPQNDKSKLLESVNYKDGRPSIVVKLDWCLVSHIVEARNKSLDSVNKLKRKISSSDLTVSHGDGGSELMADDMNLQTPDSKLDSSFSSHQSTSSHRKAHKKRKSEADHSEVLGPGSSKRQKGSHRSSHHHQNTKQDSSQKEKRSHTDDHEWDRKHPARSTSEDRRSSVSSESSHHSKHAKPTHHPSQVVEDANKSDVEDKEDQLSVPTNGDGQPSSVETLYTINREGDSDAPNHPRRLEDRLDPADVYLHRAKELKHNADNLSDKLAKSLMYTEAVLSFIQCGYAMERDHQLEVFRMYRDTFKLITHICRFRSTNDNSMSEKEKKLAVLSFRIQSLLCQKLFKLKKSEALKFKKVIEEHNKVASKPLPAPTHAPSPHQASWTRTTGTPSPMSPTPSPSGSVGSNGSLGSCNEVTPSKLGGSVGSSMSSPASVSVPHRIHSITQEYLGTVSYLVMGQDFWEQADTAMHEFKDWFADLDEQCGTLTLNSSISDLVLYVQTGLQRLKERLKNT